METNEQQIVNDFCAVSNFHPFPFRYFWWTTHYTYTYTYNTARWWRKNSALEEHRCCIMWSKADWLPLSSRNGDDDTSMILIATFLWIHAHCEMRWFEFWAGIMRSKMNISTKSLSFRWWYTTPLYRVAMMWLPMQVVFFCPRMLFQILLLLSGTMLLRLSPFRSSVPPELYTIQRVLCSKLSLLSL